MSAQLFEHGVQQYQSNFTGLVNDISIQSIKMVAKSRGISEEMLKSGLETNSKEFRQFCYIYASTVMPGRVSCTTYAAVVAIIAQHFGVAFKVYAGFCLRKSSPRYIRDKKDWEAKKAAGEEHPFFATHVYCEANGNAYEYYDGDTSGVEHLDVVEIAAG